MVSYPGNPPGNVGPMVWSPIHIVALLMLLVVVVLVLLVVLVPAIEYVLHTTHHHHSRGLRYHYHWRLVVPAVECYAGLPR